MVIAFPFLIWYLLWFSNLPSETVKTKFGTAYEQINTSSKAALLYNVLYMLRRLLLIAIAVFFGESPVGQISIMVAHSFLMIVYLVRVKPFEYSQMNNVEIFNETCVLIASYHLFMFTNFTSDPAVQYQVGWSMIGLTVSCILANIGLVVASSFITLKHTLRRLIWRIRNRFFKKPLNSTVQIRPSFPSVMSVPSLMSVASLMSAPSVMSAPTVAT